MAGGGGILYIDGVNFCEYATGDAYSITSTGFNISAIGGLMNLTWTYSGSGTFLGMSATQGATTPDLSYAVGAIGQMGGGSIYLYSVEATAPNETYITSDTDLTSVANAIRTKGGTSASLIYPAGYISAINALPTGALQSYKSAVFTSPGSATLTPDSGYVGIEEIHVEYSPSVYSGAYHMAELTDLTGTTWYFNSTISLSTMPFANNPLTFTSSGNTYTRFYFNELRLRLQYDDTSVYWDDTSLWANDGYRTIAITGGDAAQTKPLIEWFEANATRVS